MGWFRKTGTNTLTLGLENACFYVNPSATVNGNEPGLDNVIGALKGNSIADTYLIFGENHIPFSESLDQKLFVYAGKKYPIVKLADDRWWMAAPLAYVPAGKTVSSDPAEDAGIWYAQGYDGTTPVARTDFDGGYLYDASTALGVEVTAANYKNLEKAQGICPPGWYIPTRAEFFALCGNSNKNSDESTTQEDPDAYYYVSGYQGSSVVKFDYEGWNWSFLGVRTKTPSTTTSPVGQYNKVMVDASTGCTVEARPLDEAPLRRPQAPQAQGYRLLLRGPHQPGLQGARPPARRRPGARLAHPPGRRTRNRQVHP